MGRIFQLGDFNDVDTDSSGGISIDELFVAFGIDPDDVPDSDYEESDDDETTEEETDDDSD